MQEAMETLKGKPDDPEANLIAGKYLCLAKGDWPNGLPMLAKSSYKGRTTNARATRTG